MARTEQRAEAVGLLPASDWPADRAAPGALELVRRFCNTVNLESGADRFATDDGTAAWLREQGRGASHPTPRERAALVDLRESVRAQASAHLDRRADPVSAARLADRFADVAFRFTADGGRFRFAATAHDPTTQLRADIAVAIAEAEQDGTWSRLKACANCRWVLYDRSKNQSARWCSMDACGGRAKARAYRARTSRPT